MNNRKTINAFVLLSAFTVMAACGGNHAQRPQNPVVAQSGCPATHASIKQGVDPGIMTPGRDIGLHLPRNPTIFDVLIDASGKPTTIRLVQPSGDAYIDKFAMRLAKATEYSPASRNCKYRAEHFRYVEDWQQIQRELEQ